MNDKQFIHFLDNEATKDNGGKLAESSKKTIISNIKNAIPKYLNTNSLLCVSDIELIEEYQAKIIGTIFDQKRKNSPKQALKFYIKFLKSKK